MPAGTSAGWQFQLVRTDLNPDVVVDTETIAAGAAFDQFDGDLAEGTYEIRETGGPAGYDLTDVTGGTGVTVVGDTVCTFTVDYVANAGDVFDCTFENTQEGRIEIEKQTLPDGDSADVRLHRRVTTTLSDNGVDGKAVDPGQYTVSESNKAGWDLTGITCDDGLSATPSTGTGSTATFNVEPGETVRCVFNNRQEGRIEIEKQTLPANSAATFGFTGDLTATLSDNGFDGKAVDPGQYTVTETDKTGWDLTGITCDDGLSATPSTGTGSTATFNVEPGETVRCVFNNRQEGRIVIEKQTLPANSPESFDFTGEITTSLVDNGSQGKDVDPGQYTVTETAEAGWDLTGINCSDANSSGSGSTATFNVEPGETVRCIFNNRQEGRIVIEKQTLPANSPESFDFTGEITTSLVDNGSQGKDVDPGQYTVTETAEAGWDLTGINCSDANSSGSGSTATFNVEPGETVRCIFNNKQRGKIIVEKQTNPDGAAGNFTFTGNAAGTISDNGTIEVPNLAPGTYYSTEGDPTPNFDLTSIVCDDANSSGSVGTRTATFQLDPGETVKCTFTNTQRGMAKVIKTVSGGPVTQPQGSGFVFQLRSGAVPQYPNGEGTILETGEANAGNGGVIAFTKKLVPGDTYQLCEIIMPGWMTSLVGFVPNSVGNPVVDNSPICVNFTVTAGQTTEISVDNTPPPGGRALTIGFWKNWASCSGGKQKPVLDQTLASFPIASGQTTHGVYIGDLYVDTCLEATRILNKSTVNTGAKKASDPAFNLAAQLLAAKLNLQAGAGVCPAALLAINNAQTRLDTLNFNGVTHGTISNALATTLNNLATTIDNYNNNNLC